MTIRDATADDLPAITDIYAHAVTTGTGSFEIDPPSLEIMRARMETLQKAGFPWLVFEEDATILGYAYAGPFKPRAAYSGTVEDSIYVSEAARGKGVGKTLLLAVIERCQEMGKSQMIAGVGDAANQGSIALHKACGFEQVGHLQKVGHKFGRWLDLIYMQRNLN